MKIGMVAGETSGDLLGAQLIQALYQCDTDLQIEGVAGPAMKEMGCHTLYHSDRLAIMGLLAPLLRLPDLIKIRYALGQYFSQHRPDVFIGIDAPEFNLGLEQKLHRQGIPIVHYVSPSVWAWRPNRLYRIKKTVDLMLTLFPFEAKYYEQHHIPVCYVGHPLADQIPLQGDKGAARHALGVHNEVEYVALLPGSRQQDIRYLAKTFLSAAQQAWQKRPTLRFLTSLVSEQHYHYFYGYYQKLTPHLPVHFFTGRSHDVMAAADIVLTKSGTATLEAMLFKKPMVIVYCMSTITHQILKRLVTVPYIGLPNLLANEKLVPELIQEAAHPHAISQLLLHYLEHPEIVLALQDRFMTLHQQLRMNASQRASQAVMNILHGRSPN